MKGKRSHLHAGDTLESCFDHCVSNLGVATPPEGSSESPELHLNSATLRGRSKQALIFCANSPQSVFQPGENRECGYEANQSDVLCLP